MNASPIGTALEAMERADAALMRASEILPHDPDWIADALTDLRRAHTALEEATLPADVVPFVDEGEPGPGI